MSQPDNSPAFPVFAMYQGADGNLHPVATQFPGMTLRDWFAGQALPRALSLEYKNSAGFRVDGREHESAVIETAYRIADAMLAQRPKTD